ncbi:hypothetical protein [Psittacicella gerlachiana]|uniref:Uncharacterized protein n=1 Tax=Psittacicella gerlachiana TaxID=2028574 RepID=A0A3A1YFC4_9GAMM|nr:hypothetical protein [Psittacicella gerlachiana]RIY34737.1 hypothetical protein CKF59_04950 [Psittacicella gerlachiana]
MFIKRAFYQVFACACLALTLVGCDKSPTTTQENTENIYTENLNFNDPLYPSVKIAHSFYQGNDYFSSDFNFNKVIIESLLRMAAYQRYGIPPRLPANIIADPIHSLFDDPDNSSNPLLTQEQTHAGEDNFLYSLRRASYLSNYTILGVRFVGSMLNIYANKILEASPRERLEIFRAINMYFDYIMAEYRYLQNNTTFDWTRLMDQDRVSINFATANFPEYLQQFNSQCQVGNFELDLAFVERGVGELNQYYTDELNKLERIQTNTCQAVNLFLQLTALENYEQAAKAFNAVAVSIAQTNIGLLQSHNILGLNLVQAFSGAAVNNALISISVNSGNGLVQTYSNYIQETLANPQARIILSSLPNLNPLILPSFQDQNPEVNFSIPKKTSS